MKVFWCWQSDLSLERNFIQDALERAVKAIAADGSVELEPVVDRDTKGLPGSPDITRAIFDKIKSAAAFVGDVSIVLTSGQRSSPNPNVLVETGYAYGVLSDERVILIMNTAHGRPRTPPVRSVASPRSHIPSRSGRR